MKISTEIQSISRLLGEEKAIEAVAKAGFDAWDFSMFNMAALIGAKTSFWISAIPFKAAITLPLPEN